MLELAKEEQSATASPPSSPGVASAAAATGGLRSSRSGSSGKADAKKKPSVDVAYDLSVITHFGSNNFKSFDDPSKKPYEWVTFSFSEGDAAKLWKQSFDFIKYVTPKFEILTSR